LTDGAGAPGSKTTEALRLWSPTTSPPAAETVTAFAL
jgi:hypothetical protein